MIRGGGWRAGLLLSLVPVVGASAVSCGACDKKQCVEPGVYVGVDDLVDADSAVVCVDTKCDTVDVVVGDDGLGHTTRWASDLRDLPANKKVQLSISVYSASRQQIATIETTVRVPNGGNCECKHLTYGWSGGEFHRQT